ncbi:hypothetical protein PMAYCL1PPCAC_31122, partial [Pristionchus mayeri]
PIQTDKDPHTEGPNVVTIGTGYPHRNTFLVTRLRHSLLTGHRTAYVEFWYQLWAPDGRKSQLFPAHLAVENKEWAIGCTLPVNEKLLATHPTSLDLRHSTFRKMPENGEIHMVVWVAFSDDLSLKDARGRPSRDKQKAEEYRCTRREEHFEITRRAFLNEDITTFFGTFHLGNSSEIREEGLRWDYGVKSVVLVSNSSVESATTEVYKANGKEIVAPRFDEGAVEELQFVASRAHGTPFLEMEFYNDDIRTRDLEKKACPLYSGTGMDCHQHENPQPVSAPRPRRLGRKIRNDREKVIVETEGPEPEKKPEKPWAPVMIESEESTPCEESDRTERENTADSQDDGPPVKPDRSGLPVLDFVKAFSGHDIDFEFETIDELKEKLRTNPSIQRNLEKVIGCRISEADNTQLASLVLLQRLDFPDLIYYRFPHKLVGKSPDGRERSPLRKEIFEEPQIVRDRWTRGMVKNVPFFRVQQIDKRTRVVQVLKWKEVQKLPEEEKKAMIANFGRPIDFPLMKGGGDNQKVQFVRGLNGQRDSSKDSTPSRKPRVRHSKAVKNRAYNAKTVAGMEKTLMKQVVANVTGRRGPRDRPLRTTNRPKRYGFDKEKEKDDEGWEVEEGESPEGMDTEENSQEGSNETNESPEESSQDVPDSGEEVLERRYELVGPDPPDESSTVGEPPEKKARLESGDGASKEDGETAGSSGLMVWKKEWGKCRQKKGAAKEPSPSPSKGSSIGDRRGSPDSLFDEEEEVDNVLMTPRERSEMQKYIENSLSDKERIEFIMQKMFTMDAAELPHTHIRQKKADAFQAYLKRISPELADNTTNSLLAQGIDVTTWPYEQFCDRGYEMYEWKIEAAKREFIEQLHAADAPIHYRAYVERIDGRGGSADDLPPRTDSNSQLAYRITHTTTPSRCIMCEKTCRNMFDLMMHYALTHIRFAFILRPNIQMGDTNKSRLENVLVIDVHLDVDADTTKELLTYEPTSGKPVDCLTHHDLRRPKIPVKLKSKTGNLLYMTTPMETGLLRATMRMSLLTFTKEILTPSAMRRLEAERVYGRAEHALMEFDHTYKGPGAMTIMDFQTHFWEKIAERYLKMSPVKLLLMYLREALAMEHPEVPEYDRMRLFLRCNLHIIKEDVLREEARIEAFTRWWRRAKKQMKKDKKNVVENWRKQKPAVLPQRNAFPELLDVIDDLASKKRISFEDRLDLKRRVLWAQTNLDFCGDIDGYDPIVDRNSPLRLSLRQKLREEHSEWMEKRHNNGKKRSKETSDSWDETPPCHPDAMGERQLVKEMRKRLRGDRKGLRLAYHAQSEVKRIYGPASDSACVPEWLFPPVMLFQNDWHFSPSLRTLDRRLGMRAFSRHYFNQRIAKKRADRELRSREMTKAVLTRHFNRMQRAKINLRE